MSEKKHLGIVSILVKDRQTHASDVNRILSENGHLIMSRLGVNVQKACVDHCTGLIAVAVEGGMSEIRQLTKELDELYGIVAKCNILTD